MASKEAGIAQEPYYAAAGGGAGAAAAAPGRTYFINIPIKAVTGHVPEEHLDRISLNLAVYGAAAVFVGTVGVLFPILFTLTIGKFIAWLLVLGGGLALAQFFVMCGAPGTTGFLLLGILHLGIGLWIVVLPIRGGNMLILVISLWFLLHGVVKLLMSCQMSNLTTWPALLASGLLSVVLAFTTVILAPRFGLVLLSIIFGADFVVSGVSLLLISCIAFFAKRAVPSPAASRREPLLGAHHAASSA